MMYHIIKGNVKRELKRYNCLLSDSQWNSKTHRNGRSNNRNGRTRIGTRGGTFG